MSSGLPLTRFSSKSPTMTMSNNDDFVRLSTNDSLKSESDYSDFHSGYEDASSLSEHERPRQTDYWFGQRYFECIMAQDLIRTTQDNDTIETVDSRLQETLHKYPYQEALRMLGEQSPASLKIIRLQQGKDAFATLMNVVGAIARAGSTNDKQKILTIVRGMSATAEFDMDDAKSITQPELPLNRSQFSTTGSSTSNTTEQPEVNPGKYTQRLKEIGDKEGIEPEYSSERYAKDPSLFQTIVRYKGTSFDALGKNKKQSKNMASKMLCDFLDSQKFRSSLD